MDQLETSNEAAGSAAARTAETVRSRLKRDLHEARAMAVGLSAGAVLGLCGVNLLLLGTADLLSRRLPRWAARGLVGTALLGAAAAAGAFGWRRRSGEPLRRTRQFLRTRLQRALDVP